MITQLAHDLRDAPRLFNVSGPESGQAIDEAMAKLGHPALGGLRDLWETIGGGDLFETEELLSPSWPIDGGLIPSNEHFRGRGLSERLLVFHEGMLVCAIDHAGSVVAIDEERLDIVRHIGSLDDWYRELRNEYAEHYGLKPASAILP